MRAPLVSLGEALVYEDACTKALRDMTVLLAKDFNDDVLRLGDVVLCAQSKGRLAEGTVVQIGLTGFPRAVVIQSRRDPARTLTIDAEGCIKIVS